MKRDIPRLAILLLLAVINACNTAGSKKKIMYINSYHQGFPPSDQITKGVMDNLPADSFEVKSYFMDTKRNSSEEYIAQEATALADSIEAWGPDLLIVSDDNALKYLVLPHLQDHELPIVFCGINWTTRQYDLKPFMITGVIEILPVRAVFQTIKPYFPGMQKVLVLNENTTTSRKTRPLLDTLLGNMDLEVSQELVDDFEDWKKAFIEANENYDIVYLQTKGAIREWDDAEAKQFIQEHIRIPLVTCEEFMMPFAVLGLTQLSEEQGIKAAQLAKRVLSGTAPSDMPFTSNTMSKVWINADLADRIGFEPDKDLLDRAIVIN